MSLITVHPMMVLMLKSLHLLQSNVKKITVECLFYYLTEYLVSKYENINIEYYTMIRVYF
jgi:uncharacterized sporulation protein YeaH/YhbH (DUF444 family)